jgi:hypothetical protein
VVKRKQSADMATKKPSAKKPAPKKVQGRPPTYSQAMADRICDRLMVGESLTAICRDDDMPELRTVCRWLAADYSGFRQQYARAREVQADVLVDQTQDIADDGRNDWMERAGQDSPGWQLNGEHVQRSRLRIDQRKWHASKLVPKKYGDLQKIEHSGTVDVAATLSAARKRSGIPES